MSPQHPITFRCDYCPAQLEATWGQIGELVFCPGCGMETTVREPAVKVPPRLTRRPGRFTYALKAAVKVMLPTLKKDTAGSIAFGVIVVSFTAFLLMLPTSQPSDYQPSQQIDRAAVFNHPYDGSVRQVVRWIEDHANDAESVKYVSWGNVVRINDSGGGWIVRCKYRAKNGFGAYMLYEDVFVLGADGTVLTRSPAN